MKLFQVIGQILNTTEIIPSNWLNFIYIHYVMKVDGGISDFTRLEFSR
jgi:hypothetical protein